MAVESVTGDVQLENISFHTGVAPLTRSKRLVERRALLAKASNNLTKSITSVIDATNARQREVGLKISLQNLRLTLAMGTFWALFAFRTKS